MRTYCSLDQMLEELSRIARTRPGMDAERDMTELVLSVPQIGLLSRLSPFSSQYKDICLELYSLISGVVNYEVATNELVRDFGQHGNLAAPVPYSYGSSAAVGDFFLSWGAILQILDVKRGQSVIEYGAGEGQLAIALARLGCDVTVVDVEHRYLDFIEAQCERLGVSVKTHRGLFGEVPGDARYDRVVFFEAFHHSLEHQSLVRLLRGVIADDGFMVLAGEPIVESSPFVPFPWGPRLDGLSVYSMNEFGWMELGFQEAYFVELMMRSGWLVGSYKHPMTFRGNCYVAKPLRDKVALGDHFMIQRHGMEVGWDAPEGTHRWTHGHGRFPVFDEHRHSQSKATVSIANLLPGARDVEVVSGRNRTGRSLAPNERASLSVSIDPSAEDIEILSEASRVCDVVPGNSDERTLGVAVSSIEFSSKSFCQ